MVILCIAVVQRWLVSTPPPPPVWAIHILYVFALFLQLVRISLGSSRPTLHQRRYTLYVCTLCVAWFRTLVFVLLTAVYKNSEIYLITCTVYPRENKPMYPFLQEVQAYQGTGRLIANGEFSFEYTPTRGLKQRFTLCSMTILYYFIVFSFTQYEHFIDNNNVIN